MSDARMIYEPEAGGEGLRFTWSGGPYIDISIGSSTPFDVINVWDYERDEPEIEFSPNALEQAADEWLRDQIENGD